MTRARAAVLLLLFAIAVPLPCAAAEGVKFLDDWGATLTRAKDGHKLILVDFYTSWCVYCKKLDREAFADPRIVDLADRFVCAKLDADVVKAAANRYRPEGFPTLLFATSSGDEILRVTGYRSADQVYDVMRRVADVGPRIDEELARLETNRKDVAAREALGRTYLDLGLGDAAAGHFEAALKDLPADARTGAAGQESAAARLGLLLAQALELQGEHRKAAKALEKLVADHATSPRLPDYYVELEKVYTAWGKKDQAEQAKTRRLALAK